MFEDICIKIINLKHREDRRVASIAEMSRLGLSAEQYSFFEAKLDKNAGGVGCAQSHAMALADFLFRDDRRFVLVMEDDFYLKPGVDLKAKLEELQNYSDFWDVFLFAHNGALPIIGTPLPGVYRVVNAQTASGYLVNRIYAHKLIERFFYGAELLRSSSRLPEPLGRLTKEVFSCDIMWKSLQVDDRFWAALPALGLQRASYSDIENADVDYRV